jgi:hypothetical protein
MQTRENHTDSQDSELDGELVGILTAISVVAKRLAQKLLLLRRQGESTGKGGKVNGQDE